MESAITSKGPATIPKAVRNHLGLEPGDRIKFSMHPGGSVALLPKRPVSALRGIAKHHRAAAVSLDTIAERRRGRGANRARKTPVIDLTQDDHRPISHGLAHPGAGIDAGESTIRQYRNRWKNGAGPRPSLRSKRCGDRGGNRSDAADGVLLIESEEGVFAAAVALKDGRGSFADAPIGALGARAGCSSTFTFDERAS